MAAASPPSTMLLRLGCVGRGVARPAPCNGFRKVENIQVEFAGGGGGDCSKDADSAPVTSCAASRLSCTCPESIRVTVGATTFRVTGEEEALEAELELLTA